MFTTLFWLILGIYTLIWLLLYLHRIRSKKITHLPSSMVTAFITLVCHSTMLIMYLAPSLAPDVEGLLLNMMLGTPLPVYIVPSLIFAPAIISTVISIVTRKGSAVKLGWAWTGLFIVGLVGAWLGSAALAGML